jgi:hypothetical protein
MLQDRMKLFGVAALAAVATAGWMRQPQTAAASPQPLTVPMSSFTAPAGTMLDPAYAPAPFAATPVSATVVPVHSGTYRTVGAPVAREYPAQAPRTSSRARYSDPELRERSAERRPAADDDDVTYAPEPVVKERSKMKSAMIIGGGAAAGAAVGGLAGGGKGAAIGAISGGVAGLVYDRMTKNR